MSEMEERVARALCHAIGVPEDGLVADNRSALDDLKPAWVTQLPKARAAIAAMREPTQEMINIGVSTINFLRPEDLKLAWQTMLDVALQERLKVHQVWKVMK